MIYNCISHRDSGERGMYLLMVNILYRYNATDYDLILCIAWFVCYIIGL